MIPVYTSAGFQRFVTRHQHAAEVAGKVLSPQTGLWRQAERRNGPLGEFWYAQYFKPKQAQVEEWDNRRRDNTLVAKVAH